MDRFEFILQGIRLPGEQQLIPIAVVKPAPQHGAEQLEQARLILTRLCGVLESLCLGLWQVSHG